ncbi:MAG: septum formation initiator family protein [Bacteroidetes bacterium]|jgi:cell division protein FtsB|nr:septum formation initiator family protein [Bacteroidota bacterium]
MKKYASILLNKYLIAVVFVLVWIVFFDDTDLFTQRKRLEELRQLEQKEDYFKKQTEIAKQELSDIKTSKETLEKFARERYFMKKKGEDVFIIQNEKN